MTDIKNFSLNRKKRFCPFCSNKLKKIFIERRNRLFCIHCQTPVYENPIPAACVVLINNTNKVLLVKRKIEPRKGEWCLPGGFMELGENPEEAAIRELEEETGLNGKIETLIGISSSKKLFLYSIIIIGYLVREYSGILKPGDDAAKTRFFDPNKVPKIAFESHKNFIYNSYYGNIKKEYRK